MKTRRQYFPNLDILRLAAALFVVAYHYIFVATWREGLFDAPIANGWGDTLQYGFLGVTVFFILSGFLIAHVSENATFWRFGFARVTRLMPAFWICLAISATVLISVGAVDSSSGLPVSLKQAAANILLVPQALGQPFVDGVYWTLVYEFVFYGWAALMIALGIFHSRLLLIVAAWLTLSIANSLWIENAILERLCITSHSGAFCAGLLLWYAQRNGLSVLTLGLFALAIFALGFGIQDMGTLSYLPSHLIAPDMIAGIIASFACVAIVALALRLPSISRGSSVWVFLGGMSYPLYLLHQEIGFLAIDGLNAFLSPIASIILVALGAFIVASLLHAQLEKPLRQAFSTLMRPVVMWLEGLSAALISRFRPSRSHLEPAE
jgi:peptidoglycan/LPS O-acetylase OafA/YrhL